ncbi:MAG: trypsin-like peptidase domain-containing protein, partial [Candidatus Uhrbacteria bacterium]|nr:trypsin-like peptidase domain-containing protein [Candidatus Uhrbacteria bacterium]
MQIFDFKSHLPSLVAGFAGGIVSCVLLGVIAFGVLGADTVRDSIRDALGITATSVTPVVDSTGEASDVVSVVEAANPAVVSIVISKDVPKVQQYSPFGGIFGMPIQQQSGTQKMEIGGGSGFIVSDDGYIVTNQHVVSDGEAEYTVFLNDGTEYEAEVIAGDDQLDIAILKIDADDLAYLEFGDSDAVKVGQTVIAIGNALAEFRNTVSVGVVSGLSRSVTASGGAGGVEQLYDVIQTDAAINP